MSTIMDRVRTALKESGNAALAEELHASLTNLTSTVQELQELNHKAHKLAKQYIYFIQSRCGHPYWRLAKESPNIYCPACGHTVCDEGAFKWGSRAWVQESFHYGSRVRGEFRLSAEIRKRLGDALRPKEIDDGAENQNPEVRQEALHRAGGGTEASPTPGSGPQH